MMTKQHFLSVALIISFLFIACSEGRKNPRDLSDEQLKIGEIVWNSTFTDLEGNPVSIKDYQGKVVLIDFWETWCGPCLQVFPAMDSLRKEYKDDFAVIAVNLQDSDTPEEVEAFKSEKGYDFDFVLDKDQVGPKVISFGIPFKIFVDPNGYLIKAEVGSNGTEGDYLKAKEIIEDNKIN
ncbi:MAG: TlpA family protein disulfide reductase [Balneola sp.]